MKMWDMPLQKKNMEKYRRELQIRDAVNEYIKERLLYYFIRTMIFFASFIVLITGLSVLATTTNPQWLHTLAGFTTIIGGTATFLSLM